MKCFVNSMARSKWGEQGGGEHEEKVDKATRGIPNAQWQPLTDYSSIFSFFPLTYTLLILIHERLPLASLNNARNLFFFPLFYYTLISACWSSPHTVCVFPFLGTTRESIWMASAYFSQSIATRENILWIRQERETTAICSSIRNFF